MSDRGGVSELRAFEVEFLSDGRETAFVEAVEAGLLFGGMVESRLVFKAPAGAASVSGSKVPLFFTLHVGVVS